MGKIDKIIHEGCDAVPIKFSKIRIRLIAFSRILYSRCCSHFRNQCDAEYNGSSLFNTLVQTRTKQRVRNISDSRFSFSNSLLINGAPIKKLGVAFNKYFGVC